MSKRKKRSRVKQKNIGRNVFVLALLVIGIFMFATSDFNPWSTFEVRGDDATVDIDYKSVTVNNVLIWDIEEETGQDYWSSEGVDELHFDADPLGIPSVTGPISRATTFNPQIGTNFGTPRGLLLSGSGDFVEHDSIESYDEIIQAGYKHLFYKIRFRMFVSTFGEVIKVASSVDYNTENGKTVTGTDLPTTKSQRLIFTMSISTALTDVYPSDVIFKVTDVNLGPREGDMTHVISSEVIGGGVQDILYSTYTDDSTKPLDEPYITDYDNILVNYIDSGGDPYLTDGAFTVDLTLASGAIFDEDTNSWYLRDANVYFDFDIGFEFIVNEYSNARWSGSLLDTIIAHIPARLDVGLFATDPMAFLLPVIVVIAVLGASLIIVYTLLARKVKKGLAYQERRT